MDRRTFLWAAPASLIVPVIGRAGEPASDGRTDTASADHPTPVAPQFTDTAVRQHRFTKFDLEMIEDLGF